MINLEPFLKAVVQSRSWIAFIAFIFALGVVSGAIISLVNPDITRNVFQTYGESIQKIAASSGLETALLIFERNAFIVAVSMLFGFLGIVPILVAYINGMLFGMIFGFRDIYSTFSIFKILLLILPHGLLEIATTLVALGISTRVGLRWVLVKKDKKKAFVSDYKGMLKVSLLVIGFLAVSALIEAIVTPALSCFIFRLCF